MHLTGGRLQTRLQAATWWHTDRFGTNSTAKVLETSRGLGRTHAWPHLGRRQPKPTQPHSPQWLSTARGLLTSRPTRSGHNPERHRKAHVGKRRTLLANSATESWKGYANVRNKLPRRKMREGQGASHNHGRGTLNHRSPRHIEQRLPQLQEKQTRHGRSQQWTDQQTASDTGRAASDNVRHGRAASDNWIRHLPTPHPITAVYTFFSRKKQAENKS